MHKELSSNWHRFVDCNLRRKSLEPFFRNIFIEEDLHIADLGCGSGCDLLTLSEAGYINLHGNEVNTQLLVKSKQACDGCSITWSSYDWTEIGSKLSNFDAILLLGNSLALVTDRRTRMHVLAEMRRTMVDGGLFVVDHRNFSKIMSYKAAYLERKKSFRKNVMYCGKQISAAPAKIEKDIVRMDYLDHASNSVIGHLDMYPITESLIKLEAEACGFSLISTFYDLGNSNSTDAEFITHLFEARN